jgi:hypothetical protein
MEHRVWSRSKFHTNNGAVGTAVTKTKNYIVDHLNFKSKEKENRRIGTRLFAVDATSTSTLHSSRSRRGKTD